MSHETEIWYIMEILKLLLGVGLTENLTDMDLMYFAIAKQSKLLCGMLYLEAINSKDDD